MKRSSAVSAVLVILVSAACGNQDSVVGPSSSREEVQRSVGALVLKAAGPSTSSAPADLEVPFKGRFEGAQTVTPLTPPLASVEVHTAGTGTHLGRFTMTLPHTVNFATASATGVCTIVAANGDVLTGDFIGQAQVGPVISIVEHVTITGGTGRFSGATGTFVITRTYDPAAGRTWGSFEGTISAPPYR